MVGRTWDANSTDLGVKTPGASVSISQNLCESVVIYQRISVFISENLCKSVVTNRLRDWYNIPRL